jgi:prepilin-type N-terminal cleavage/methylation domain-containing protein
MTESAITIGKLFEGAAGHPLKRISLPSFPRGGGNRGFTLVEVIVVLVILAILAAIAIPALTGYIKKADDKKWIADARNAIAAMRSVINEAYADGTLDAKAGSKKYTINGTDGYTRIKYFAIWQLSKINTNNMYIYYQKAAELMGKTYTDDNLRSGYWAVTLFSPNTAIYTALNAPAFMYSYFPKGAKKGNEYVTVLYGIDGVDPDAVKNNTDLDNALKNKAIVDMDVGYKVLNLVRDKDP